MFRGNFCLIQSVPSDGKDFFVKMPNSLAVRTCAMSEVEQKVRLGIGCAAAASAIFAPLSYKWKAVLSAVAAAGILTGLYRVRPVCNLI
jgi:hypothetical protein